MHYFKYNVSDFVMQKSGLSLFEQGVFMAIIDHYIKNDGKIDFDQAKIAGLLGIRKPEEIESLRFVLAHRFVNQDGMLKQPMIDQMIEEYSKKSEKSKASVRSRWESKASSNDTESYDRNTNVYERNTNVYVTNKPRNQETKKPVNQETICSSDSLDVGEEEIPSRNKKVLRETKKIRSAPTASPKGGFDFSTGKFTGFSEANLQSWITAYPAISVTQELAKMSAWLMSNPKNRKSDYLRFVNNWLSRAQDAAGRIPPLSKPEKFDPTAYINRTGKYAQQPDVIDITEYTGAVFNGSAMVGK